MNWVEGAEEKAWPLSQSGRDINTKWYTGSHKLILCFKAYIYSMLGRYYLW